MSKKLPDSILGKSTLAHSPIPSERFSTIPEVVRYRHYNLISNITARYYQFGTLHRRGSYSFVNNKQVKVTRLEESVKQNKNFYISVTETV